MKIEEYSDVYDAAMKATKDKDLALAIMQQVGEDRRQAEQHEVNINATPKQLNFIKELGGEPDEEMTKKEASELIDELLSKKKPK